MNGAGADRFASSAAAYAHIPFCSALCPYCDYAAVEGRDDLIPRYVAAVVAEIAAAGPWRPLDAVCFGGGTPSRVDPAHLGRVVEALGRVHTIAPGAEISLEANPEDFTPDRAETLREHGFNRVCLGAQSFDAEALESLGRRHTPEQVAESVDAARSAGLASVSLDLVYGAPGESEESWETTLARALELSPDHVSCYALTVEPGAALSRAVDDGAPSLDPGAQADRHELADSTLSSAGLHRYEICNWSKPGRESVYNLTVWGRGEYEGYGASAHGHRDGRRFHNVSGLDAYIAAVEGGWSPRAGSESVAGRRSEVDRLLVGLRRSVGVAEGPATAALLRSAEGRRLSEAGVLASGSGRLRIAKPLLADAVHRAVIGLRPPIVTGGTDA